MKYNMGCGFNKIDGYINIDKFLEAGPDLLVDLELTPWPIESNSADEVRFNHSLEHMGAQSQVFLSIIQELYRICTHEALIHINVPHPRHDFFIDDPTHVRIITPNLMALFSKRLNLQWVEDGSSNSPLGRYLNVDFEVIDIKMILDEKFAAMANESNIASNELLALSRESNNVISEYRIIMKALKD